MSEKTLRVGVIGPGGMGRERCREFAATEGVELVAAADNNEQTLERLGSFLAEKVPGFEASGIKNYVGDYEFSEMLDKEDLDIVGIFSPHSLHDIHAKAAMRAGCHVVIEKPMANYVGDAIAMARMSEGSKKNLVVHYQRHYSPLYVSAKKAVEEGILGEITGFDVYLAQRWGGGGWRGDPRFSGGGQPNDSGSHLQDMFLWISGLLPKTVTGKTSNIFEMDDGTKAVRPIEIDAEVDVITENGAKGHIQILGNTRIGFDEHVILEGEKGKLTIKGNAVTFKPKGGGDSQELPRELPDGYPRSNIDNLIGLIRGTYDKNYCSSINGVRTSWLTNCILATGNDGGTVDADEYIQKEGYSREDVKELIRRSQELGWY
jgi:predicted dehydrogenase